MCFDKITLDCMALKEENTASASFKKTRGRDVSKARHPSPADWAERIPNGAFSNTMASPGFILIFGGLLNTVPDEACHFAHHNRKLLRQNNAINQEAEVFALHCGMSR